MASAKPNGLKWLRGAALLAAMVGGPAQAAVYTGAWDATYGAPFTGLGWRGSATFTVPSPCDPINADGPPCGAGAVSDARVEFYDAAIAGSDQPTMATLVFSDASFTVLAAVLNEDGDLDQIATTPSNSVQPAVDLAQFRISPSTAFFLEFMLDDGPRLGWEDCQPDRDCVTRFNNASRFPVDFTIDPESTVPEPTTLWLGALALAALVPARRRTRPAGGR